jgi:hypothetical protein
MSQAKLALTISRKFTVKRQQWKLINWQLLVDETYCVLFRVVNISDTSIADTISDTF